MAARKKTPRKKAPSKSAPVGSGALVPITPGSVPDFTRHQSAIDQQQSALPAGAGMPRIRIESGTIYLPGAETGQDSIDVIVLAALRRNAYFGGKFDPSNPGPPVCGAIQRFGQHENDMAPEESWPGRQHEKCYGCPQNIPPNKPCRNSMWLACVAAQHVDDYQKTPIVQANISSTGIQPFAKLARDLSQGLYSDGVPVPLFGAVLRLENVKVDKNTYFTTLAEPVAWVPAGVADILSTRVDEAVNELIAFAQPQAGVADAEKKADRRPEPRRRKKAGAKRTLRR